MKYLLIILFFPFFCFSQSERTIYANKQNNVFLHFQAPIKSGIVGNDDFVFAFDNENDSSIGIIKCLNQKAINTNLLVTTKDNLIYSYIISFKNDLQKFIFFVEKNEALNFVLTNKLIVSEKGKKKSLKNNVDENINQINNSSINKQKDTIYSLNSLENVKNLYKYDKELYMNKIAKNLIGKKAFYLKSLVIKNNLLIKLLNIKYDKNELYFAFEIKNKGTMDLNIDYLIYEINSKSIKKRTSAQAIEVKPIYNYKLPKVIKGNSVIRFIAVFEKFTISNKKVFILSIKEENGERDLEIPIMLSLIHI